MGAQYVDTNLQQLFRDLEPRHRRKVLKSVFAKEARQVKEKAQAHVRASKLHNANALSKGVRYFVLNRQAGFCVTVQAKAGKGKADKGMHRNRAGKRKPLLKWFERGTPERYISKSRKRPSKPKQTRKRTPGPREKKVARDPRYRGKLKRYGFLAKTEQQVRPTVTQDMRDKIPERLIQIAKKYGAS